MKTALHARDRRLRARCLRELGGPSFVELCETADEFVAALARASLGVIATTGTTGGRAAWRHVDYGGVPVLLVTDRPAEAVLDARRVVDSCAVELELTRIAWEILITEVIRTGRAHLSRIPHVQDHPTLHRALLRILSTNEPPVTTVKAVANHVGCSRRQLERQWTRLSEAERIETPRNFLEGVCVLHALQLWLRSPRAAWSEIAEALGPSPRTLRSYLRRRTGRLPSELAVRDVPRVVRDVSEQVFRRRVVREATRADEPSSHPGTSSRENQA